eukprot:GFUD01039864.1.p1 GENE.GFUD01039864.1~~GFUD01039864.1.p1  ORF type:complete len:412 (-),score=121.55 GFUD01039864.1:60-1295(-)
MTTNPQTGPPPPAPPLPYSPYVPPYGYAPMPPPFYSWGSNAPPPPQPPVKNSMPVIPKSIPPCKPSKNADFTQHALNTVVAAAGAVATNAMKNNPNLKETPHIRTGLAGVKRKALATELLSPKAGSYHLHWTSAWESPMPPELLSKCKPLHCELCSCHATSPLQAKMHYEGKTHDKHVRNFFASWPGNTDSQVPQKLPGFDKKTKTTQLDPSSLHCSTCDLHFTSLSQLEQHITGRNHARLAAGLPGLKPGYFNQDSNKWQRNPLNEEIPEVPPNDSEAFNLQTTADLNSYKFFCDLCKVGAPSQSQIDMHLNGKNHKSKMKRSMGGVVNNDLETIQKRVQLKDNILSAVSKNKSPGNLVKRKPDYSVYRTPSGQYYCAACNLSLNSESQFSQHQVSKKHKQKETVHKARK